MSLRSIYERFLASPNPLSLSENASLHYIPTLTTFSQSGPIIRHLESQNKTTAKKKAEKIIDIVEGHAALVMEVETTLEFISGGGAYLPGLENFVTDKVAMFPVTHTVRFDDEGKIQLIRMSWDQGSLLSQVEVIGSRGKHWPISDGKAQARLISSGSTPSTPTSKALPMLSRGRDIHEPLAQTRSMSPSKKHIKDPYASLNLFEGEKENRRELQPASIAPRASAKPAEREMSDLFAAGHEDYEPSHENGGSPKKVVKHDAIAPKAGGSQKFLPSRLFEEESDESGPAGYKSNPAKYDHFDIGEELEHDPLQFRTRNNPEHAAVPMRAKTDKHLSQWDFGDFVTPGKAAPKVRGGNTQQLSISELDEAAGEMPSKKHPAAHPRPDADTHFEFLDAGTPVAKQPAVHKSRPDTETHFDFQDAIPPEKIASGAGRDIALRNSRLGLYANHVYDDGTTASKMEEQRNWGPGKHASKNSVSIGLYENHLYDDGSNPAGPGEKKPLKTISNNAGRSTDMDAHWGMTDSSPPNGKTNKENKPLGTDRINAHKRMDSNWDTFDESPDQSKKRVAGPTKKGLESHWGFDAEEEVQPKPRVNPPKKAHPGLWDF